jgi:signal transduction histidine kinase
MLKKHLLRAVDWFVPEELRSSTAVLWRARIFAISHLLGPWSAVLILTYLYRAEPNPSLPFWTIVVLCFAFWLLPFGMKLTRSLTYVAVFSICDLTFVSVFGSFFYGGVSSPFLPWFLTALLLGFFYLSEHPLLVLGIFAVHLMGFCIAYAVNGSFPELVPVAALSTIGVLSVCAATIYTSMMAVYYASVMTAQSELRQEIDSHLVTAAKMRKAKEEADRANEAKAVFLAKMSHQLRTPLNAIIGYSEILLEDADLKGDKAQSEDLKMINSAGRHLLSLVSDVLYMPKIDSEDIELSMQKFDLRQLIDDVAATCRSLVTQNGNEFVVELPEDLGTVVSDETRLRQVMINLLSNAGKFTSRGKVTLRARRVRDAVADDVVISVQDTGIGIPAAAMDGLFTKFNQANALTSKSYGGTGLGLALSRTLCQVMNGDISVESELQRGSTFTVRIPAVAQLFAPATRDRNSPPPARTPRETVTA